MPGKNIYENIRTAGGISLEYADIIESDFAAAGGAAYSPPEEGTFRRINVARAIQLVSDCPVVVETFQTSNAVLRLPASTASETTDDAGDGRLFVIKNSGNSGTVALQDYLGAALSTIYTNSAVLVVGNSINNWDIYNLSSTGTGGSGVTPPFMFSKSGGTAVGAYLYVGQVVSSKTGQLVTGSNYIVKLTVSNAANVASNTTLQLRRRTGLATFVDIAGAAIVISSGSYSATLLLSTAIPIGPDWEISCYNKSGSSVTDCILLMYVVPA